MKKMIVALLLCLLYTSAASAEISRQYNHEAQTFSVISTVNSNYDEDMKLKLFFEKEFHGSANNVTYSLIIFFDPIDENKPMKSYEFFKDGFSYFLEGDTTPRTGAFWDVYSPGIDKSKDRIHVSVSQSTPGEYTVTTTPDFYQHGGSFATGYNKSMEYYRKYKLMKPQLAFYDDLMYAVKNNKEMTLKLPYAKDLSNVDQINYVTFKISKDTLNEWNQVANFDLRAELQKLQG